ncbi:MAG: protein kinase [bacterium]|nr:protein kinase [bacterium]
MPVPRLVAVNDAPSEAVIRTLLMTDLVDSTRLVQKLGDSRASDVAARHDRAARDLLPRFNGLEIDKTDGFLLLFERPIDALAYALAYHQTLSDLSTELDVDLQARAGIHLGEILLRENSPADVARGAKRLEVEGLAKPTTSRVMSLARGKQTLLTHSAFDLARRSAVGAALPSRHLSWLAHGPYRFKGVEEPLEIYEAGEDGLAPLAVPPDSAKAHRVVAKEDEVTLGWRPAPDLEVPQRPNWTLEERLGVGGFGEVWLARHKKTDDKRVFKFCLEPNRLRSLQREVTLFRLLKETLGHRDDITRILDWNFDEAPYFLESEYTEGGNLVEWAAERGGLTKVPLRARLELLAQVAEALGAAHSVGVLHKDVKPANVLVRADREGRPKAQLTDFGIGLVVDESVLSEHGITLLGLTEVMPAGTQTATGGTYLYMAPEVIEGKPATIQADVYALGIILYQMVAGDFAHPLSPGWRRDIHDEILADDIAQLVDGSPERRLASASEIADRLRRLDERRRELQAQRAQDRVQRRRKLLASFGAVATFVLLVVSILALQATRARQEADLRRDQAEDLISFMLGDLREKLEPLGRLEILDDVGEAAMSYFRAVPETDLSDEELFRRSAALHQIGDVRIKLGDLSAAMEALQESLALAEELVKRDPENPELRAGLGESHFWVGHVHWLRLDLDRALEQFRRYLESSEALLAQDPENRRWQKELSYAHGNIGTILQEQGQLDSAVKELRASLSIKQALASAEPTNVSSQLDLARAHNKVGWVLENRGDLRGALEHYRSDLALKESLGKQDPDHTHWRYRLAVSHSFLGNILRALGDLDSALHHHGSSLQLMTGLVIADPDNSRWQRELALAHTNLGADLRRSGGPASALGHSEKSLAIFETLVEKDSSDAKWRRDLGIAHRTHGMNLAALDDVEAASEAIRNALRIFESLADETPGDATLYVDLGKAHGLLGDLWNRSGESEKGRESWRRAVDVLEPWARDSSDWRNRDIWARALVRVGRHEDAASVVQQMNSIGYADREFLAFCRQHRLLPAARAAE